MESEPLAEPEGSLLLVVALLGLFVVYWQRLLGQLRSGNPI